MSIAIFRSMLSAVAYVLGENSDHYFTMTENREWVMQDLEGLNWPGNEAPDPNVLSTIGEFLADNGRCAGVCIDGGGEAHAGSILVHYTDSGEIVRFVAIR